MTGRQRVQALLSEMANNVDNHDKLLDVKSQYAKLKAWSDANYDHVAHTAVEAFLVQSAQESDQLKQRLQDAYNKIKVENEEVADLFAEAVKIANDKDFLELLPQMGKTAQSLPEFIRLLDIKDRIDFLCPQAQQAAELDEQLKDFTVINHALDKFKIAAEHSFATFNDEQKKGIFGGDSFNKATENFHGALDELFVHASNRFKENNRTSMLTAIALELIGIAMIAASIVIALTCPLAGALALGMFIGGCGLVASGLGTLFYKKYTEAKEPMRQIGVTMEDEENRVKSLAR